MSILTTEDMDWLKEKYPSMWEIFNDYDIRCAVVESLKKIVEESGEDHVAEGSFLNTQIWTLSN